MTRKDKSGWLPAAPDISLENSLWEHGIKHIAGIDEVGRGALAGPVAAAALILPADQCLSQSLSGVRDSKQMTPLNRKKWAVTIKKVAVAWAVDFASSEEIDAIGIVPATRLAMARALAGLPVSPDHLLIDYLLLSDSELPQTALIKGDARSLSIAGASILAKTTRDALLEQMEADFPGYSFASHKGYATTLHLQAIQRLGPCRIHRRSFAPLNTLPRTQS